MTRGKATNRVRIIAGQWRGRQLLFADAPGLRPTGDRIRETLFNWLQPIIHGARCLDVFAGSGALGFEAASRGAAQVVMLENHPATLRNLQLAQQQLQATQVQLLAMDALHYLQAEPQPCDVVFVDPPFQSDLYSAVCQALDAGWLHTGSYIYVESALDWQPSVPAHWQLLRDKRAGQVAYRLYQRGQ